jgi:hypothetical protein
MIRGDSAPSVLISVHAHDGLSRSLLCAQTEDGFSHGRWALLGINHLTLTHQPLGNQLVQLRRRVCSHLIVPCMVLGFAPSFEQPESIFVSEVHVCTGAISHTRVPPPQSWPGQIKVDPQIALAVRGGVGVEMCSWCS